MEKLESLRNESLELMRLRSEIGKLRSVDPMNLERVRERLTEIESSLSDLKEQEAKLARIEWGMENRNTIRELGYVLDGLLSTMTVNGITTVPASIEGFDRLEAQIELLPQHGQEWNVLVQRLREIEADSGIGIEYFEIPSSIVPDLPPHDESVSGRLVVSASEVLLREREPRLLFGGGWGRYYGVYNPGYSQFGIDIRDHSVAPEEYRELAEEILGHPADTEALEAIDPKLVFSRWESKQTQW